MEVKKAERHGFIKGLFWGMAAVLLIIAAVNTIAQVTGGQSFGFHSKSSRAEVLSKETKDKLGALADLIDQYYYQDTTKGRLSEAVYHGLLEGLEDPYSVYYTAAEYKTVAESTSGIYAGVGMILSQEADTGKIIVARVYPNSPAKEAGVKEGDTLLSADDVLTDGITLDKFIESVKGEEGTILHLVVSREGEAKSLEMDITRKNIEVPTVEYEMLDGETGFIQITSFTELTAGQFRSAIADLNSQGMAAMIVDVRDNPGGLVDSVCEILDEILPEGILVYTEDKHKNRTEYMSKESAMVIPLAVLINENSASAAEIFAGAVKDYKYGTIIGATSFGKGIVQQIMALEDGSAVKLTTSSYFTPNGNYIHEVGIAPDIELKYEYLNKEDAEYNPMHDNQVLKALEILQSK